MFLALVQILLLTVAATKRPISTKVCSAQLQTSFMDIPEEVRLQIYRHNPAAFYLNPTVSKEWAQKRRMVVKCLDESLEEKMVRAISHRFNAYVFAHPRKFPVSYILDPMTRFSSVFFQFVADYIMKFLKRDRLSGNVQCGVLNYFLSASKTLYSMATPQSISSI